MSQINRYKITKADVAKAIKFIQTKKGHLDIATWVEKFREKLSVKNKKLYFEEREIIPREEIDNYLRKRLYSKKDDAIQMSRDAAFYQLLKETVGITRRKLMDFLKAQRTLGQTRAAQPAPKSKSGKREKGFVLETDLVFIRRDDLILANPRFEKKDEPKEQYALVTVEKATGLCKITPVKVKEAKVVTPLVKKHIEWFAKRLKKPAKEFELRSDKGGEFNHTELAKHVGKTKFIAMGPSVEKKNRQIQQNFYRILRNRQALTVANGLAKAENMANNCYSRIQKATPNEAAEQKQEETLKKYNKKRATYQSNSKRKPLEVDDLVRIQIKTIKTAAVGFKSYKDKTYSAEVYKIKKRTKSQPYRYWLGRGVGKWVNGDLLLKTRSRDKVSDNLIQSRDDAQEEADKQEAKRAQEQADKDREANRKRLAKKEGVKPSMKKSEENISKIRAAEKRGEEIDKLLDDIDKADQKKKNMKKPKHKRVKVKGWKPKDEDYVPEVEIKEKPKLRRNPRRKARKKY